MSLTLQQRALTAVKTGNYRRVSYLIKKGVEINCKDSNQSSLLHNAADQGSENIIVLLIKAGADIECKDKNGNTPINIAVIKGHKDVVDLLIKAGANKENKNNQGIPPLGCAARNGHKDVVDLLIKAGADIECKCDKGNTPLSSAAIDGLNNIVDLLIKAGANKEKKRRTPFSCASIEGHTDKVDLLIKAGADIDCKDVIGNTPLKNASLAGHTDVMDLLINAGANKENKNNLVITPLGLASFEGHAGVVDLLIKAGADIDCKEVIGNTPLNNAALMGHTDVVDLLITAGADIDCKDVIGETPLNNAALTGHTDVVDLLINAGANKQNKSNLGITPIGWASINGQKDVVNLLIKAGADIECKNNFGNTPIGSAAINGHKDVVDLLIKAGAKKENKDNQGGTPLGDAAIQGHKDVVDLLIKAGADIECKDNNGNTPLSSAAIEGHTDMVDLLIKACANKDNINNKGHTPILLATEGGYADTVNTLSEKVSEVSINDAFLYAIKCGQTDVVKCLWEGSAKGKLNATLIDQTMNISAAHGQRRNLEYLMTKGISLETLDAEGYSPLFNAVASGILSTVTWLWQSGANLYHLNYLSQNIMHLAASFGRVEIVKFLVENKKLDSLKMINCFDRNGQSPISSAISNGHFHSVRQLHALGADLNINIGGNGLLHLAAQSGCLDIYQYLIIAGLNNKNEQGKTANECFPFLSQVNYRSYNQLSRYTEIGLNRFIMNSREIGFKHQLSALSSVPGLGRVDCISGNVSQIIVDYVNKKDIVKDLEMCGSTAEGTKVQLPDEIDYLKLEVMEQEVKRDEVDNLDHGYVHLSKSELKKRFRSSKTIHSEESSDISYLCAQSSDMVINAVAGGGSASVPVSIRWREGKTFMTKLLSLLRWHDSDTTGPSLLVSVDIVPTFHVDDWPDDAVKKTWLMDEETLRKNGYQIVAKPPHKDSKYGQSLPEEDRERMWRISYSNLEPKHIAPLDPRVKDAYITAKCLRTPLACGIVIRDTDGVSHFVSHFLTSYLLKTVFMHNVEDFLNSNKSLPEMVYIIYSQLEGYLAKGNLPFFWQPTINLFEGLKLDVRKSHQVARLMTAVVARMRCLEEDGDDVADPDKMADGESEIGCYIVSLE